MHYCDLGTVLTFSSLGKSQVSYVLLTLVTKIKKTEVGLMDNIPVYCINHVYIYAHIIMYKYNNLCVKMLTSTVETISSEPRLAVAFIATKCISTHCLCFIIT